MLKFKTSLLTSKPSLGQKPNVVLQDPLSVSQEACPDNVVSSKACSAHANCWSNMVEGLVNSTMYLDSTDLWQDFNRPMQIAARNYGRQLIAVFCWLHISLAMDIRLSHMQHLGSGIIWHHAANKIYHKTNKAMSAPCPTNHVLLKNWPKQKFCHFAPLGGGAKWQSSGGKRPFAKSRKPRLRAQRSETSWLLSICLLSTACLC